MACAACSYPACIDLLSDSSTYEGKILVRMSRFFTCVFAIFMGFLSVLLHVMGLNLGWVYQVTVTPC